jgi:hypothetical protein
MNRHNFLKFSNRPCQSCDTSTLRLLEVKSGPPSFRIGGIFFLRMTTRPGEVQTASISPQKKNKKGPYQ